MESLTIVPPCQHSYEIQISCWRGREMKNLFGFLVHILRKSSKMNQSSGSLSLGNLITTTRNDKKKECQPSLWNRYSYVLTQPHVQQSTLESNLTLGIGSKKLGVQNTSSWTLLLDSYRTPIQSLVSQIKCGVFLNRDWQDFVVKWCHIFSILWTWNLV